MWRTASGNLLHLALSMISTAADVEHAVVRLVQQGIADTDSFLGEKLHQVLGHPI
ncbi:MAG: hypothetical protein IPH20_24230 [Bacteroidales bacterium]|nr:hypothetical protein [Bacteroidales bacterium]